MAVWSVQPVERRPVVTLRNWAVFEVPRTRLDDRWSRHLVGWSVEDQQAQVSSAVRLFDPLAATFVTKSGRLYRLHGPSGLGQDAKYVWVRWKRVANILDERDISDEVQAAIQGAQDEQHASVAGTDDSTSSDAK